EGRSPNDDPAIYRIKFAGSFVAIAGKDDDGTPTLQSDTAEASGIRVNSVGTILEVVPKPKPSPKADQTDPAAAATETSSARSLGAEKTGELPAKELEPKREVSSRPVVVITEAPEVATIFGGKKKTEPEPVARTPVAEPKRPPTRRTGDPKTPSGSKAARQPTEPKADPLASIRLVVEMKDGEVIERPMNEVRRFSVDKGVLTVIDKDGKVTKYSIFDVAKVTIE
ncbi:MAG: hypothetical protein AB7J13_17300, partial [Pyrinomonadaceae bacterium]